MKIKTICCSSRQCCIGSTYSVLPNATPMLDTQQFNNFPATPFATLLKETQQTRDSNIFGLQQAMQQACNSECCIDPFRPQHMPQLHATAVNSN